MRLPRMLFFLALVAGVSVITGWCFIKQYFPKGPADGQVLGVSAKAAFAKPIDRGNQFSDDFQSDGVIEESGSMKASSSRDWWLNSGGLFEKKDGMGLTIQGELPAYSKWRLAYLLSNPEDTDNGLHPQNIFRFVTRSAWQNLRQQAYFRIAGDNLSDSAQRNQSNGLLFFNRYRDGNNLYYTGIRVDGAVVIKKKINGTYYTVAYQKYFPGAYDRNANSNLLPKNTWVGLKSEVVTNVNGSVSIKAYLDLGKSSNWTLVSEAIDSGSSFGSGPLLEEGFAGIRTDFMDVQFDDYRIEEVGTR